MTMAAITSFRLDTEVLDHHQHQVLSCLTPEEIVIPPSASCSRHIDHNYECVETESPGERDHGDSGDMVVPPGQYLMIRRQSRQQ